jgi:hypothetical protein
MTEAEPDLHRNKAAGCFPAIIRFVYDRMHGTMQGNYGYRASGKHFPMEGGKV